MSQKIARAKFPVADKLHVEQAYQNACPGSFLGFIGGLIIPSARGPRMFAKCMVDFQKRAFKDMAASVHAVRDGVMPPKRRFWLERTKKASKDGDLGAMLLWLAAFPTRPMYMQVGAADRDQAGIVKRRISDILKYNDWLNEFVEINRYKIRHKKGLAEVDILAADVAGSHGETPDVLVLNELSHVTKWEFLENLMDNATGVPQGVVMIATNAGFLGSKAAVWRENAESSKDWSMHVWDKPSPWLDPGDIEDAKQRNSRSRFRRLYYGQWVSGKGDAFDEEDIEALFVDSLEPLAKPEPGWQYVAGLDLGVSHDHAGLVLLGVPPDGGKIRVVHMGAWEPEGGDIDLERVEREVLESCQRFHAELYYDPWQAKLMSQRLRRQNLRVVEMPFSGSKLNLMANTLKQVVEDHQLESFDLDGRLRRDLGKLTLVEKSYGYRLEATSDEYGHADVGTALAICLPRAVELLEGKTGLRPDDVLVYDDDTDLSKEEVNELPDDLRAIYEIHDEIAEEEFDDGLDGDLYL